MIRVILYILTCMLGCQVPGLFSYATAAGGSAPEPVRVYHGTIELPSYEFSARELQPPLFGNSTIQGKYPFPPFKRPFKPGGPEPATYEAIFLENEYLKVTVVPEFGGRLFSVIDKTSGQSLFYRNDVLKPAGYNMKGSFPLFGIELTGPYDTHMITLNGEPLWFNKVVRYPDGSAALVMGNIDPVYRMKVNFTVRLLPGLSAMELSVFCYNARDSRKPYMFWISGSMHGNRGTRFIYPMSRTIGHTTSEVADWPFYGGADYSWIRNNKHMLGVFGIDIYDNFQGAYDFDRDYGTFRFADRRVVQGMKTWTFGISRRAANLERAYTDNAGPYIEVQSGRHVWDGHYEWLSPHKHEGWSEWWFPVSGIGGLTTTSRDLALNLEVQADPAGKNSSLRVGLSANRRIPAAGVHVAAACGGLLSTRTDLAPGEPYNRKISGISADSSGLTGMLVTVTDSSGKVLLSYRRPDTDPGRKEYTPFTRQLEKAQKTEDRMTAEELVLAAELKFKQMNQASALRFLHLALAKDDGLTQAHLPLGIYHYSQGRQDSAIAHLERVIERDPYSDEAYYYLALSLFELGDTLKAERYLYYIPPISAYYDQREYLLGRLALLRGRPGSAAEHLGEAITANGSHLSARNLLALCRRLQGHKEQAREQLEKVEETDPTNRWAAAERFFLNGRQEEHRSELIRLLGAQSQEALELSLNYSRLYRWEEAAAILKLAGEHNGDPYGTVPVYYYTLAYCLERAGRSSGAAGYLRRARNSAGNLDRFPFRPESLAPLADAVVKDPYDTVARFNLGCLLYHLGRFGQAIFQWERAVEAGPQNFESRRALGLAYAEQGYGVDRAAGQLEQAAAIDPNHLPTLNDLSDLYARAGRFEEQLAMLGKALTRSPGDDNLVEGMITVNLIMGRYDWADSLIQAHKFAPRHRHYRLRDKYRFMRYGMGAEAFNSGDYEKALHQFNLALTPPVSMGVDDFEFQSAPRLHYYIARALEALGQSSRAAEAYRAGVVGWDRLSGDRDSWNSENFHMVLSLEKLGLKEEARKMLAGMEAFARSQLNNRHLRYRSEARYLLALVMKKKGRLAEAKGLLEESLQLQPDLLGPRFELRGHVVDPLKKKKP